MSRVAAIAVIAAALAVGPFGLQAGAVDFASFSANATGYALRVTVDLSGLPTAVKTAIQDAYTTARDALPADQQASLPAQFPFTIDQYLSRTTTAASNTVTKAVSSLGDGFMQLGSETADAVGQDKSSSVQTVSLPPPADDLDISVLDAVAGSLKAAVSPGPKVEGKSTYANASVAVDNWAQFIPQEILDAVEAKIDEVNTTIDDASGTLDEALDNAADAAEQQVNNTPLEDVLEGAGVLQDPVGLGEIRQAVALPDVPDPFDVNVDVATLTELLAQTSSSKTSGLSASDSKSGIKEFSLLGGLVSVSAVDMSSHSEAGATSGTAKNAATCSLVDVRVGGDSGVGFDGQNIYVAVDGAPVPVPVSGATVAPLKTEIDALLAQAGVGITLCDTTQATAAPDGTSATQKVSGFVVTFEPTAVQDVDLSAIDPGLSIPAGQSLGVKIVIDPTVQTSAQAAPVVSAAQLPQTGAPVAATLVSGLALAAGAFTLRRKMR